MFLTPKQISKVINLESPLTEIILTQDFGKEFLWRDEHGLTIKFYEQFGLKGHNGLDFRIYENMSTYAVCNGIVTESGDNNGYGINLRYETEELDCDGEVIKLEIIHGHLKSVLFAVDEKISRFQEISICNNTGKFTTGDHLHFGIRVWYKHGDNWNFEDKNGYAGWINPDELFFDRGWKNLPVINRYYKLGFYNAFNPSWRPWHAYLNEIKVAASLWRYLGKRPTNAQINACVYGAWRREEVANDAMFPMYSRITRSDYVAGKLPKLRY